MKYHVGIGDERLWVERSGDGLIIDGEERVTELSWTAADEIRLTLDGAAHRVFARPIPSGWRVTVRGRTFDVAVEDERTWTIREMTDQGDAAARPREVRAPMPGLVVRVLVEPGQQVAAGDGLVVVEAMKMENELRAQGPGTIATVSARSGEAVDRDDILVTFEEET